MTTRQYKPTVLVCCRTCGFRSVTGKCTNTDLIVPSAPRPPEAQLAWRYCDGMFWAEREDEE